MDSIVSSCLSAKCPATLFIPELAQHVSYHPVSLVIIIMCSIVFLMYILCMQQHPESVSLTAFLILSIVHASWLADAALILCPTTGTVYRARTSPLHAWHDNTRIMYDRREGVIFEAASDYRITGPVALCIKQSLVHKDSLWCNDSCWSWSLLTNCLLLARPNSWWNLP